MTTVRDLVERTRHRWLEPSLRRSPNKLAVGLAAADTSVTLTYDQALDRNKLLGIDQEVMFVWSYDSTSKTAVVDRGWKATTAAIHTINSVVDVDARWFRSDILGALLDDINGWPTGLYQVSAATVTVQAGQTNVDLPTALLGLYGLVDARINHHPLTSTTTFDTWGRLQYAGLVNKMPVGNFPSQTMVKLGITPSESTSVRLVAAMPFSTVPFTESTDITTVGLTESLCDLAEMGAAVRLIHGMEAGRTDRSSQGEARRANEAPPMYATQAATGLERRYRDRLRTEMQRLQSFYPIRVM